MIMASILSIMLMNNPNPAEIERDRLSQVMAKHNVFSAKILNALAEHQCEAIAEQDEITEFDLNGQNFIQRIQSLYINPKNIKMDELYFKSYHDNWLVKLNNKFLPIKDHIEEELMINGWSHYGLAIRQVNGAFYIVLTFGDLYQVI